MSRRITCNSWWGECRLCGWETFPLPAFSPVANIKNYQKERRGSSKKFWQSPLAGRWAPLGAMVGLPLYHEGLSQIRHRQDFHRQEGIKLIEVASVCLKHQLIILCVEFLRVWQGRLEYLGAQEAQCLWDNRREDVNNSSHCFSGPWKLWTWIQARV